MPAPITPMDEFDLDIRLADNDELKMPASLQRSATNSVWVCCTDYSCLSDCKC